MLPSAAIPHVGSVWHGRAAGFLLRILQRFCSASCSALAGSSGNVGLCDAQVMLPGHARAVPDPLAYDVLGERGGQLRFTGGPQIVCDLRPDLQAGSLYDFFEARANVGVAVAADGRDVRNPDPADGAVDPRVPVRARLAAVNAERKATS